MRAESSGMELASFKKEVGELALSLSALHHRESTRRRPSENWEACARQTWDLPAPRPWTPQLPEQCRIHFWCLNYAVSVALLSQPQGTKTSV